MIVTIYYWHSVMLFY